MPKAARRIVAVLLDNNFPRQKRHRDLAALRVFRNEGGHVSVNGRFTPGIAGVHALCHRVIDAIELHLQFVVAEGENAKLVVVVTIDAVGLCSRHDFLVLGTDEVW